MTVNGRNNQRWLTAAVAAATVATTYDDEVDDECMGWRFGGVHDEDERSFVLGIPNSTFTKCRIHTAVAASAAAAIRLSMCAG